MGDPTRPFPYVSYLRVYEPLDAFSDAQQLAILEQRARERELTESIEHDQSLRRVLRSVSDPFPHHEPDLVRVTQFPTASGRTAPYYCPNQLAVRTTLAAESLDHSLRGPLIDVLVPDVAREAHQARLDPDTFADSVAKLHTRSATWGVPFAWFALIHEDDLTEVVEDDGRVTTVRVTARIGDCIDRGRRCVAQLAIGAPEMDLLDELTEIVEWLEIFRRDAVVEVDYGPVADRVFPDDSPMDVRLGIESLAEADMMGAAASYRRLASRWIPIRQLARAS
ncbi:MAG: hypothetical protein JWM61_1249 [Micrococcaceae bacterium]|jgi:hypothetical protein|uniref:DUF8083 domain-containing protein n=1 Tax=Arthrobacter cheniae TaxID=1258888 RepID=A0A3A5MDU6_9MICC|nr:MULTISPECIES: hypothetical protein [Arthrobacter]MCU1632597.1 hypothetical protein [Micrococcaceae bacterium]RJT79980.1 hypothetical protein D6T63_08805 [Arthrobacter cheniae]